jgi:hypothetical protein
MSEPTFLQRFRSWLAGLLFLAAGRLDQTYDVWLDDAPLRHPERHPAVKRRGWF